MRSDRLCPSLASLHAWNLATRSRAVGKSARRESSVTSRRYLAWLPDSRSSPVMYFSTPQMVQLQFECLPMMRFLLAEGTVRLSRDRDMVSVDFDGAGFARRWAAAAYPAKRFDLRGIFLLSDRKC